MSRIGKTIAGVVALLGAATAFFASAIRYFNKKDKSAEQTEENEGTPEEQNIKETND